MKKIAYVAGRHCFVIVLGPTTADEREWAEYMAFLRREVQSRQRPLVVSRGAGLEHYQRRAMMAILNAPANVDRRVAMVTGSTFARGILKAMSLIDPSFRGFAPAELDQALRYLEVPESAWPETKQLVETVGADVER